MTAAPPPSQFTSYLLLAQDKDPMRLDGVPGSQVLARAPQLPILVGRPQAVPRGPGNTDVVPFLVLQAQGQLGDLDTNSRSEGL